jgi:putative ABC transport system permease protein
VNTSLWIALRALRARRGALLLTVLAVALATATALTVPLVSRQVERGAQDAAQVFDLLIAAPGSPTQALTSSLFYLDAPNGNLPASVYEDLKTSPGTRRAVPIGLGDNHLGFPVVGTSTAFFDQRIKPKDPPYFRVAQGRIFGTEHEVVAGARAAREAGLRLGSTFKGAHGLEEAEHHEDEVEHEGVYRVVGILQPTGGPVDRALLTPIETIWEAHGQLTPASRQVTAVLSTSEQLAGI